MKAVAKHAVLLVTLLATSFAGSQKKVASAESVRIGTLTYQPNPQDGSSGYFVSLDATYNVQFGAIVFYVKGVSQASGPVSTPVQMLAIGSPNPPWVLPSCIDGCVSISLQLLSPDGKAMTATRWDGKTFSTWGVNTITMVPNLGQTAIVPGQSVGIFLMADPKGL